MTGKEDAVLRPAVTQDAAACGQILQDWLDETEWMPDLRSLEGTIRFCGRLIDEEEVTVAQNGIVRGFLARRGEDISALYVANDARRLGLGTALLKSAQEKAEVLSLWTFQTNEGARRFYARHGFREVARTAGDNEEGLPDVRLEWSR